MGTLGARVALNSNKAPYLCFKIIAMFRMMRAVPRMASVRTASLKGQVVVSSKVKVSSKLPALASMRGISCAQPGIRNDFETRWIDYFERWAQPAIFYIAQ